MSMHSVGLEPTKLILTGTWTTYQATGDAGTYTERVYTQQELCNCRDRTHTRIIL